MDEAMKRRRFMFWIGFGLFNLAEKLRAEGLDELAAAGMNAFEPATRTARSAAPTHWRAAQNSTWRWYERETFVGGRWVVDGTSTPIHKRTGQPYTEKPGYLSDSLVPDEARVWDAEAGKAPDEESGADDAVHRPDPARRARHGRPPSKWLRSLRADELRIWLKTIEVPEAGVEGMTYMTHLTRDHFFDADKLAGLSIGEQAKLHAAAHHGY